LDGRAQQRHRRYRQLDEMLGPAMLQSKRYFEETFNHLSVLARRIESSERRQAED